METHVMATPFDNGAVEEAFQPGRKARKEYKCHACDKVFKRSEHFTRHVRVHTKERPFSCRFCQKTYGRKDLVRRHEKTLHAELCEMAAADNTPKSNARPETARSQSGSQPDFNHGAYPSNVPYSMHEPQDGQLYSPTSTEHTANYDTTAPVIPQHATEPSTEALLIDPMLEGAFGNQGFQSSDRFAQNGLYNESEGHHQSSPYYHQSSINQSHPLRNASDYGVDTSSGAHEPHDDASEAPSHGLPDPRAPNSAYGHFDPYQQSYPPDYQ